MQQQSKNRAKRSGSNAGGSTPTLVPIPMNEDIEKIGESADHLRFNVRTMREMQLCDHRMCLCTMWGCEYGV